MCMRESIIVEEGLPLCDHALFLVIQHNYFDGDIELSRGRELGEGHLKGAV